MTRPVATIAVARTIRSDLANMSVVTNLPVTAVLGAGAWGTALASLLAAKGVSTRIWAREPEVAADIGIRHENRRFLAGFDLPAELEATSDTALALRDADVVVNAVPTQHIRSVLEPVAPVLVAADSSISVSKGIEMGTLATPHQILGEMVVVADKVVALSGPSFADEVAACEPTAVTVAGVGAACVRQARDLFSTTSFRVYSSPDIISVELGGALKNVMAIAVGISDGIGFGRNTRAALIARGLAEITRLGEARGSDALTLGGLSGVGDLVLTCTGDLSRNRNIGIAIGRGDRLPDILASTDKVAEGVQTSIAAREMGLEAGIELPITNEVCAVLHENKDPRQAVLDLMSRVQRDERWK